MSKKARYPQTPRHILIYDEDWEYLETRFGSTGLVPVGVSNVIRSLIHKRVVDWREAEHAAATAAARERKSPQHESEINDNAANIVSSAGSPAREPFRFVLPRR